MPAVIWKGKKMLASKIKRLANRLFMPSSEKDARKLLIIREQYGKHNNNAPAKWLLELRNARLNYRNASSIPLEAAIGNNVCFPHGLAGIFISVGAQIGENCTIFQNVIIGSNTLDGCKHPGAPVIGDHVFIGAGAVILGGVRIGNHVRVGANTTVVEDVPDNSTVVSDSRLRIIVSETERENSFVKYKKWKKNQTDDVV